MSRGSRSNTSRGALTPRYVLEEAVALEVEVGEVIEAEGHPIQGMF